MASDTPVSAPRRGLTARQRLALNTTPLLLRLLLGSVFLWYGLGKMLDTVNVAGDSAAVLANLGVIPPPPAAPTPTPDVNTPTHKSAPAPSAQPKAAGQFTAADFPGPVRVTRLYTISVTIFRAANPLPPDPGAPPASTTPPPTAT